MLQELLPKAQKSTLCCGKKGSPSKCPYSSSSFFLSIPTFLNFKRKLGWPLPTPPRSSSSVLLLPQLSCNMKYWWCFLDLRPRFPQILHLHWKRSLPFTLLASNSKQQRWEYRQKVPAPWVSLYKLPYVLLLQKEIQFFCLLTTQKSALLIRKVKIQTMYSLDCLSIIMTHSIIFFSRSLRARRPQLATKQITTTKRMRQILSRTLVPYHVCASSKFIYLSKCSM